VRANDRVTDGTFRFDLPKGARIVDQ
jgi:hypothetical protein